MDNNEILELLEPTFYVSTDKPYSINYSKLHDIVNPDFTEFFCEDFDLSISNWDFFQDPEHYYNVYIKQPFPDVPEFFLIIIQQGHNGQGWASAKFLSYGIEIDRSKMILDPITNEITFDFLFYPYLHGSQTTDYSTGGFDIIHEFETNNVYEFETPYNLGELFNIVTLSDVSYKKCIPQGVPLMPPSGTETIPPEGFSQNTLLRWKTTYPNGEYPNVDITIGLSFKNLLPNKYVPMDIRLHKWTSLDNNNLVLMERGISDWEQIEKETYNTKNMLNRGHNRYRDIDGWKQLPPGFGSL